MTEAKENKYHLKGLPDQLAERVAEPWAAHQDRLGAMVDGLMNAIVPNDEQEDQDLDVAVAVAHASMTLGMRTGIHSYMAAMLPQVPDREFAEAASRMIQSFGEQAVQNARDIAENLLRDRFATPPSIPEAEDLGLVH